VLVSKKGALLSLVQGLGMHRSLFDTFLFSLVFRFFAAAPNNSRGTKHSILTEEVSAKKIRQIGNMAGPFH
jgi:hypothetical protein